MKLFLKNMTIQGMDVKLGEEMTDEDAKFTQLKMKKTLTVCL